LGQGVGAFAADESHDLTQPDDGLLGLMGVQSQARQLQKDLHPGIAVGVNDDGFGWHGVSQHGNERGGNTVPREPGPGAVHVAGVDRIAGRQHDGLRQASQLTDGVAPLHVDDDQAAEVGPGGSPRLALPKVPQGMVAADHGVDVEHRVPAAEREAQGPVDVAAPFVEDVEVRREGAEEKALLALDQKGPQPQQPTTEACEAASQQQEFESRHSQQCADTAAAQPPARDLVQRCRDRIKPSGLQNVWCRDRDGVKTQRAADFRCEQGAAQGLPSWPDRARHDAQVEKTTRDVITKPRSRHEIRDPA
jgi:hypothetical protein